MSDALPGRMWCSPLPATPAAVRRAAVWLPVVALTFGTAGCGSSTGSVSGKVSYNGTVLKGGTVTFVCADGRSVPTGIREDGSYSVEKLPLGPAKICVDTSWLDPKKLKAFAYAPPPGKADPPGPRPPGADQYVQIPPRYADPSQTDLTLEVKGGSQGHDIQLK